MTPPNTPGPGTRLLAEQLGSDAPVTMLTARHPPGDPLHRLARALCQTATDLDAAYAQAQQAGRELRALRGRLATGTEGADDVSQKISSSAAELELMLERCEVSDTALVRLLGVYQDIAPAPGANRRAAPAARD
ncbi:hypothetical protein [Streptomyces vastus]|uniref:Uncharacterized protein n=1 Tax=Streptomyces vastus TaxID=285451 RepID=A0ABN3RPC7_9ACTN